MSTTGTDCMIRKERGELPADRLVTFGLHPAGSCSRSRAVKPLLAARNRIRQGNGRVGLKQLDTPLLHFRPGPLELCQIRSPVPEMDLGIQHANPEGTVFGQIEALNVAEQLLVPQQPLP